MKIPKNLSLREAYRLAREFGFHVEPVNGTGEMKVWREDIFEGRFVRVNNRRHDSTRPLIQLLREACRAT
jgi:hypothetical protein